MNWGSEDFAAAAILLGSAGIGLWAARRFAAKGLVRLVGYAAILGVLVLIWAELAVGIFH